MSKWLQNFQYNVDTMAEWLRRGIRVPMGLSRISSNLVRVVFFYLFIYYKNRIIKIGGLYFKMKPFFQNVLLFYGDKVENQYLDYGKFIHIILILILDL